MLSTVIRPVAPAAPEPGTLVVWLVAAAVLALVVVGGLFLMSRR